MVRAEVLRVDSDGLARRMRDQELSFLVRATAPPGADPRLAERLQVVLGDTRAWFPAIYIDLDGPVPWGDEVWGQIRFRGRRRAELADLIAFIAQHAAWGGLDGELVQAPRRDYGGDKPWIRGLTGGMYLAGRDPVRMATYPPADTPRPLVAEMLGWADVAGASKVWISTHNEDRRADRSRVQGEVEAALVWASNIAVATSNDGVFRRVIFNRNCILATVSCSIEDDPQPGDADRRQREIERFADLFGACRRWFSFAAVVPSGMNMLTWSTFLANGAHLPPYGESWQFFANEPVEVVPDPYVLQLHTPRHAQIPLGPDWKQRTFRDGYRLIQARNIEPWLYVRRPTREELWASGPPPWTSIPYPPRPDVLAAARAEFEHLIARTPSDEVN